MPSFFELASYVSQRLLTWSIDALVGSAVVLLVCFALWRVCENRLTPRLGFWLFFLVLVRPFIPIDLPVANNLALWTPSGITQFLLFPSNSAPETRRGNLKQANRSDNVRLSTAAPLSPLHSDTKSLASDSRTTESHLNSRANLAAVPAIGFQLDRSSEKSSATWGWKELLGGSYLLSVALLFCRVVLQQLCWRRTIRNATAIAVNELSIDLSELCRIAQVRRAIRVVELSGISSPAIWGNRHPTLVLPSQLWRTLSTDQLKWIVLHELAHVYRGDAAIQVFQRCLLILQFWNPFAWVAHYFVNRCREDDCDDLALHWSGKNFVSAGEAFVNVVRYAMQQSRAVSSEPHATVALFSASSKYSCRRRLQRLIDTDRKLHLGYGLKGYGLLTLACMVLLPSIHSATVAQEASPVSSAPIESGLTARTFELRVVDANGNAIPNAEVEIRSNPKQSWKVLVGSWTKDGSYGQFMRANESGVLTVEHSGKNVNNVSFSIFATGFAPFWASWSMSDRSESLPARYTAVLDAGISMGGVIEDDEGNLIENAQVHPSVEYKKRAEDKRQLGVGREYTTDSKGRWQVDTIPADSPSVYVTVTHSDFMPTSMKLEVSKFRLVDSAKPSEAIKLSRGLTLSGLVSDANGDPIPDAIVRTQLRNETLEATTDALGKYHLPRCAEGSTAVAVTASGFGPEVKDVNIQPGMSPVDFILPPGNTIRVRVTDSDGKPIKRTRMFFQRWRNRINFAYQMGMMFEYTDENGVWESNSAPQDALVFDVCPPGSMQIVDQSLAAREDEYHFVATPLLTIKGTVFDVETHQPINSFHVTPGNRWIGRNEPSWHNRDAFDGSNGSFEMVIDRVDGTQLLSIQASGYAPLTSRDIQWDEGRLEMDFALKKAQDVVVQLLRPDGTPASKAEAALGVGDTQIVVSDGQFNSSTFAERIFSNEAGQLNFGARTEPFGVIIVHDSGYSEAVIDPTKPILKPISLVAWGKVNGQLHIAETVGANYEIVLNYNQQQDFGDLARVRHENRVTTTATGEFSFEHILPVSASIGINVITHASRTSGHTSAQSHRRVIVIEPGKTTRIELGGSGHSVKGKLLAPVNSQEVADWEFSRITIVNAIGLPPPIPYPADLETDGEKADWFQNWRSTPASLPWMASSDVYTEQLNAQVRYMCGVEDDGTFAIHDLPTGSYTFEVELDFPGKSFGPLLGRLQFPFTIEADEHPRATVVLGELQVQP